MTEPALELPRVQDAEADGRFRACAARHGWDPDDPFVGGYVAWEWAHSRHAFDGLFTSVRGRRVLELGCHFGGTAIVLAALGAEVTALDVDPQFPELTGLNAARYGMSDRVRALHVPDSARLPFDDAAFDAVSCNSVLEYVPRDVLGAVQREIDRVLAPRGLVFIIGTSNRLWPREAHSGRWLMNYVPHRLRGLFPGKPIESVSPLRLRRGFRAYADLTAQDGGRRMLELKAQMGTSGARLRVLAAAGRALAPLGAHVGMISPTITMVLQKPELPLGGRW